jgi:thiamine pyrophosphokinase
MSSHHIVRDNQEPALVLLDGDASMYPYLMDFLEWSPAIIVHEQLLDEVLPWGIKIDAVLFEEPHRHTMTEKTKDQVPLKLINYDAVKNPMEATLDFLQQGNYSSLNIFSSRPEVFSILEKIKSRMNIVVIQNNHRWSLIRSNHFEKWVTSDTQIILRKNDKEEIIYPGSRNKVSVTHSSIFWIGESL